MAVYVGKVPSNPKGMLMYIPARGRTVTRNQNYKLVGAIADSWNWKENSRLKNAKRDEESSDKKATSTPST